MKNTKKLLLLGTSVLMVFGLTSCSNNLENSEGKLSNSILTQLVENPDVQNTTKAELLKFAFTGVDFVKNEDKMEVGINGLTIDANKQKAYTNINYTVGSNYFDDIKSYQTVKLIDKLDEMVNTEDFSSFQYVAMNNMKEFNSTMNSFVDKTTQEGSKFNEGFTYGLQNLKFDEVNNKISFDTKQSLKYTRNDYDYIPIKVDGKTMIRPFVHYREEFKSENRTIDLNVSKEEMAAMKEDNNIIFEKFVNIVKNNETTKYKVTINESQKQNFDAQTHTNMDYETSLEC